MAAKSEDQSKLENTVIKDTPVQSNKTPADSSTTSNINKDLEVEHIRIEINNIVTDVNGRFPQAMLSLSGVKPIAFPKSVIKLISYRKKSDDENATVTIEDAKVALQELKETVIAWEEYALAKMQGDDSVIDVQSNDGSTAIRNSRKRNSAPKNNIEKSDINCGESSGSDSESVSSISDVSEDKDKSIIGKVQSKIKRIVAEKADKPTSSRVATASTDIKELERLAEEYIKLIETGENLKASKKLEEVFSAASEGLNIGINAAGLIPIAKAYRNGDLGSTRSVKLNDTSNVCKVLGGTDYAPVLDNTVRHIDDGDDSSGGMEFSGSPLNTEREVEPKLKQVLNECETIDLGSGIYRKGSKLIVRTVTANYLQERVIVQKRIFNAIKKVIKKSNNSLLHRDTYKGIIDATEAHINGNNTVPIGCYEVPTEVTIILSLAVPMLYFSSYVIAEIQKFNQPIATSQYFVVITRLHGTEGRIRPGESTQHYFNRMMDMLQAAKVQHAPTSLVKLGIIKNGDQQNPFLQESIVVWIIVQQLYYVLGTQKGGKQVRNYITEAVVEQSVEGTLTLKELSLIVQKMTREQVGLGSNSSKENVTQTHTFNSVAKKYNGDERRKNFRGRSKSQSRRHHKNKSNKSGGGGNSNAAADESSSSDDSDSERREKWDKLKACYQDSIKRLGSKFKNLKDCMKELNQKYYKKFDDHNLFSKIDSGQMKAIEINKEIADRGSIKSIYYMKLSQNDRALLTIIRDLYGRSGKLSSSIRFKYYYHKIDTDFSVKVGEWRNKHNISFESKSAEAHSSVSSKKSKNSKKASKSGGDNDAASTKSGYSSDGFQTDDSDDSTDEE